MMQFECECVSRWYFLFLSRHPWKGGQEDGDLVQILSENEEGLVVFLEEKGALLLVWARLAGPMTSIPTGPLQHV